jgi:hypothetical protein
MYRRSPRIEGREAAISRIMNNFVADKRPVATNEQYGRIHNEIRCVKCRISQEILLRKICQFLFAKRGPHQYWRKKNIHPSCNYKAIFSDFEVRRLNAVGDLRLVKRSCRLGWNFNLYDADAAC